jgi:hypothetical protein
MGGFNRLGMGTGENLKFLLFFTENMVLNIYSEKPENLPSTNI